MRKRAASNWLDDLPSRAQMTGKRSSSSWSGPVCYWNNASMQCLALAWARPQNAPYSMCRPTTLDYSQDGVSTTSGLSQSSCESRTGFQGFPCEWHHSDCNEPSCSLPHDRDQVSCESSPVGCHWKNNSHHSYCTEMECYYHKDEVACLAFGCSWLQYGWKEAVCTIKACNAGDRMECSNATSTVTGRRRSAYPRWRSDQGDKCWWNDARHGCELSIGCMWYHDQSGCSADGAGWGNCHWDARDARCTNIDSCEDYQTESQCVVDAVGAGEKTFPGAKCMWTTGPTLTVGPEVWINFHSQIKTSQNLAINTDKTLKTINENDYYYLDQHLGLRERWEEKPKAIGKVLGADGVVMNMSDIPTPIPDGFQLLFASCQDNLPPRSKDPFEFMTACNHHGPTTCDTAFAF